VTSASERKALYVLAGTSSLCVLFTVVHVARALPNWSHLNYVSGVWLGLAADVSHGIWFRPILSELGYGGAIYLPAYFASVGALMRAGMPAVAAGFTISVLSGVLLCAGVYGFLRRQQAGKLLSMSAAFLSLGAVSVQHAITSTRGDLLSTALTFVALSLYPRPYAMAALFTLAFSAEITAVYGVMAVTAFFLINRRWRESVQLAGCTALGYGLVLLVSAYLSDGRVMEGLLSFGVGEFDFGGLLRSPILLYQFVREDLVLAPLLIVAAGIMLASLSVSWRELPSLLFVSTLIITLVVFAMPGIDFNHLADLHVATVAFLLMQVSVHRLALRRGVAFLGLMAVLATAAMTWHFEIPRVPDMKSQMRRIERATAEFTTADRPIFSTNPLVPIMGGNLPFLADPFSFSSLKDAYPELVLDLHGRIETGYFGAIVLHWDVATPGGRAKADGWFGKGFTDAVYGRYEEVDEPSAYSVFVRRRQ